MLWLLSLLSLLLHLLLNYYYVLLHTAIYSYYCYCCFLSSSLLLSSLLLICNVIPISNICFYISTGNPIDISSNPRHLEDLRESAEVEAVLFVLHFLASGPASSSMICVAPVAIPRKDLRWRKLCFFFGNWRMKIRNQEISMMYLKASDLITKSLRTGNSALIWKLAISMASFNSYVKLPDGI